MSYDDTKCPCGSKKPTQTMLCEACVTHLETTTDAAYYLRSYQDEKNDHEYRRRSAMRLLSIARRRKSTNPKAA